jgi:hypothetical protein
LQEDKVVQSDASGGVETAPVLEDVGGVADDGLAALRFADVPEGDGEVVGEPGSWLRFGPDVGVGKGGEQEHGALMLGDVL